MNICEALKEMQKGKKAIAEDFKKSQTEAVIAHNKVAEEVNNHAITIDAIDVELQDLESRYENDPYSISPQEQIEYAIWQDEPAGYAAFRSVLFRLRSKIHKDLIVNQNNSGYKIELF